MGETQKVDAAVQPHQRDGLEVADDGMGLDGWVPSVRSPHRTSAAAVPSIIPKVCTR